MTQMPLSSAADAVHVSDKSLRAGERRAAPLFLPASS